MFVSVFWGSTVLRAQATALSSGQLTILQVISKPSDRFVEVMVMGGIGSDDGQRCFK